MNQANIDPADIIKNPQPNIAWAAPAAASSWHNPQSASIWHSDDQWIKHHIDADGAWHGWSAQSNSWAIIWDDAA